MRRVTCRLLPSIAGTLLLLGVISPVCGAEGEEVFVVAGLVEEARGSRRSWPRAYVPDGTAYREDDDDFYEYEIRKNSSTIKERFRVGEHAKIPGVYYEFLRLSTKSGDRSDIRKIKVELDRHYKNTEGQASRYTWVTSSGSVTGALLWPKIILSNPPQKPVQKERYNCHEPGASETVFIIAGLATREQNGDYIYHTGERSKSKYKIPRDNIFGDTHIGSDGDFVLAHVRCDKDDLPFRLLRVKYNSSDPPDSDVKKLWTESHNYQWAYCLGDIQGAQRWPKHLLSESNRSVQSSTGERPIPEQSKTCCGHASEDKNKLGPPHYACGEAHCVDSEDHLDAEGYSEGMCAEAYDDLENDALELCNQNLLHVHYPSSCQDDPCSRKNK